MSEVPAADTLIDYGGGWFGPIMFHWLVEGIDAGRVAGDAGFNFKLVHMYDDLAEDDPIMVDYSEYDGDSEAAIAKWKPTSPGEGWKLVSVDDSEDGPFAMFVRPSAPRDAG